ncbi:hypothetical protein PG999_009365 [Apiospora kogelbergensis]|uniref:Zn(2)-C6 fungal-type domain-containing protein n=1 Tax=Apiospora kogelbergensis TaxID=1337665 RepID=A0AAW0QT08_9PEZI
MQNLIHNSEKTEVPLGQRRGISNLARFALDLSWASAATECPLGSRAYPSPPMSGSPPLPPKPNLEAGERGQSNFQPTSHDVYRTGSSIPGIEYRAHSQQGIQTPQPQLPPPMATGIRTYPGEAERATFPYRRPEEAMGRPISYHGQVGSMVSQSQYPLPPVAGHASGPSPYSLPTRPQPPENPPYTSPKSQRKTKGHVASACVPCKRAHLRCDAQRPCSRCLSNGKEDACVDVQHKKRGRPRLRDDRESRFDAARFGNPTESSVRRPVSLFAPVSAPAVPYDDPLRRTQSYRVLKSQPPDPTIPRYLERGSASDANVYPPPLTIAPRPSEPVAFLTVDLEVARVSGTFVDAIGAGSAQAIQRRRLEDLILPQERERVLALQRSLQDEQARKDPTYLPPIFGRQEADRVFQALPFDPETISRFLLDRQDTFYFQTVEGQSRQYPIRLGLVKEESIYFVVVLLITQSRSISNPSPSAQQRDLPYAYQPQSYTQLTPVSASFEPNRHRWGELLDSREPGHSSRQPVTPASIVAGPSPGVSPNIPSYSPSSSVRSDHPSGPSYHIPRSELSMHRPSQPAGYQLPPIRSQAQPVHQADPRTGRVDIGGLLDQPNAPRGS